MTFPRMEIEVQPKIICSAFKVPFIVDNGNKTFISVGHAQRVWGRNFSGTSLECKPRYTREGMSFSK